MMSRLRVTHFPDSGQEFSGDGGVLEKGRIIGNGVGCGSDRQHERHAGRNQGGMEDHFGGDPRVGSMTRATGSELAMAAMFMKKLVMIRTNRIDSVVTHTRRVIRHGGSQKRLPGRILPRSQVRVHVEILLRNRMRSDHDLHVIAFF